MKKLKLQIEELKVESFHSSDSKKGRGTVHGHSLDPSHCATCSWTDNLGACAYCSGFPFDCPQMPETIMPGCTVLG